jgi:hypothetical protein
MRCIELPILGWFCLLVTNVHGLGHVALLTLLTPYLGLMSTYSIQDHDTE